MSRREKMVRRLLSRPSDFTFAELDTLLKDLGYQQAKSVKTSGSRRAYISKTTRHVIRLHRPHPGQVLKMYQVDYIIQELKKEKLL